MVGSGSWLAFILTVQLLKLHVVECFSAEFKKQVIGSGDDVHVAFSSGCTDFQNWQSEVLLYSWATVKQPGRITRIVGGCKDDAAKQRALKTAVPNGEGRIDWFFHKEYAADVDNGDGGKRKFAYFNKPFGMEEWLRAKTSDGANATIQAQHFRDLFESVIVLIDPDMFLMKPFEHYNLERGSPGILAGISQGSAKAQKYGIGVKWLHWGVCDTRASGGCFAAVNNATMAARHFSVGPPYILHVSDWLKVAPKWTQLSPAALSLDPPPSMLAEMYSFAMAAAWFDLRPTAVRSMLSNARMRGGENWKRLADWRTANWPLADGSVAKPHVIHYCALYQLGRVGDEHIGATTTVRSGGMLFGKQRIPRDFLFDCSIPLLLEMPQKRGLSDSEKQTSLEQFVKETVGAKGVSDTESLVKEAFRRELLRKDASGLSLFRSRDVFDTETHGNAFMLYHILKTVNAAVGRFRQKYCAKGWNKRFVLAMQQPAADESRFRVNYEFDHYENLRSWIGG